MASAAAPRLLPVASLSAHRGKATAGPHARRAPNPQPIARRGRPRLRVDAAAGSKADPVEERDPVVPVAVPAITSSTVEPQPQVSIGTWKWKGYNIRYQYAGTSGPALVLVHGFGANSDHWRKNIPVLAMENRVYAIDLIGYGYSDKPNPREIEDNFYTFETWGEQLNTFCTEVVKSEAFFICNSIGGIGCLYVSTPTRCLCCC